MDVLRFELENGIRVVHAPIDRSVAHCGLFIDAGSRDERPEEQGMAHFIEHMMFKGTSKRKAYHILSRMEDVGGELNAFTGKEDTTLHTSFLSAYYGRAIELMSDILLNPVFPAKEITKEKAVIVDEIYSYEDSPSDLIFDDFEEMLFPDDAIGKNILGTPEIVRSFKAPMLRAFRKRRYAPGELVFASVGRISEKKLRKHLEEHLGGHKLPAMSSEPRIAPQAHRPQEKIIQRETYQSHCILGNRCYDAFDQRLTGMALLNNLLGGPGMNSRLNLNVRERYGFTYHIESYYQAYSDTGVFGVYLGTDKGQMQRSLDLVQRELKKLREKPLGVLQLSRAKKQLLGQLAIATENNGSLMLALGKSLLQRDRFDSIEELAAKVEAVGAAQVQELANDIFDPSQLSTLVYQAK